MKIESALAPEAPASAVRWHGAVDGIHQRLLYGWACDSLHPDARVVVEVCLDCRWNHLRRQSLHGRLHAS